MQSHQGTVFVGPQVRLQDHAYTRLSSDFFAAVELLAPSCGSTSRL